MPIKKSKSAGEEGNAGSSALLALLRQYLSQITPSSTKKKQKEGVLKHGRASHRKVYVKNLKIDLDPKKKAAKHTTKKAVPQKNTPPAHDENIVPEIERSLEEYISRRSAYLNRAAGETAPSLGIPRKSEAEKQAEKEREAASSAPRTVGSLYAIPSTKAAQLEKVIPADELIPVAGSKVIEVQLPTIVREESAWHTKPAATTPSALDVEPEGESAASQSGFMRLLKYLPFVSSTMLETAKRTDALSTQLEATKRETYTMAQRIRDAEARMASWGQPPAAPVASATITSENSAPADSPGNLQTAASLLPIGATILPVQTVIVQKTVPVAGAAISGTPASGLAPATAPTTPIPSKGVQPSWTSAAASPGTVLLSLEKPLAASNVGLGGGGRVNAAQDRKKELENEEKKAEISMMSQAKKIPKHKSTFFAELSASMQYMGMAKQRISMVQNLGTMLNAGLPLIDALRTLQMESKNKAAKKLLRQIMMAVDNGSPLWRAMNDQHFFSPHAIALIRIGEEAGNLAQNMQYLAEQQEKDQALKEKVQMAMIYPSIVMVLMFIIVVGLGTFVLPNLIGVLQSLNADLPFATIMLIKFTEGFTTYGAIVIPSIIVVVIILAFLAKFTRFKIVTQWIAFHIPGIGKLAREATLARFGVILGGLLQAGVPLVEALRSLVEVTPTVAYKNFYRRLLDHVNGGDSFARSFTVIRGTTKILPVSIQQLVITGEKTGSLAQIMLKISDIYEKEANNTAQKLPVILEPLILLFIGGLVGTIAFAIIIPIYSIVGKVGK